MITECAREADVLEAVAFGRWPDHAGDLVAHAAACPVCSDLVEVARALQADRQSGCREAQVPTAGMVWGRATIRARAEAARTVTQPITVAQGIAGACAVGIAGAAVSVAWQSVQWIALTGRVGDLVSRLESRRVAIGAASSLALEHGPLVLLAVAACIVLAPIALYITLADD
jgi:hypothetical protein